MSLKNKLLMILCIALAIAGAGAAGFFAGVARGKAQCEIVQAKTVTKADVKVKVKAKKDIARASSTGREREVSRVAIDDFFTQLAKEAQHEPTDPVDACVLPDSRLRLWRAANSGRADFSATRSEPDRAAEAAPAAGLGPRAGSGGQPPGSGEALSPVGIADLPAPEVPGIQP